METDIEEGGLADLGAIAAGEEEEGEADKAFMEEEVLDEDEDDEEEDFVEFVLQGEEYAQYEAWRKKAMSQRLNENSLLPAGTYGGAVRFDFSFDSNRKITLKYTNAAD